jgi:hypothetical protein
VVHLIECEIRGLAINDIAYFFCDVVFICNRVIFDILLDERSILEVERVAVTPRKAVASPVLQRIVKAISYLVESNIAQAE